MRLPYLWSNLSDHDFESLVRDLLQEKLGLDLESFTKGRDQGIDLRAVHADDGAIVVQAKHFVGSRASDLVSSMKRERVKLQKLACKPRRYILVTSLGLTPANKSTLASILAPYLQQEADIIGQDDLENFLAKFPKVENRHFKLWLANGDRLTAIENAVVLNRSGLTKGDLMARARLFVPHPALGAAREMLNHNHACIISGRAGVGKTTLAKMLILTYLADGFEFYDVSSNIDEATRSLSPASRQIFLYDDFLGRTNLSPGLTKNEDSRLLQLMDHIKNTENKRIILTTREYILQASKLKFDRLDDPSIDSAKLILEVTQYSRLDRAKMLYNHLYFDTSIDREDILDLLEDKKYFKIVDHPNFNPRLIEDALRLRRSWSGTGAA